MLKAMLKKTNKKKFIKNINGSIKTSNINRENFCGSIDLKIEPIAYQRKIRNEWK